jgi:hypothetical protein
MLVRFMLPNRASRRSTQGAMMASHVTSDSTHDGPFKPLALAEGIAAKIVASARKAQLIVIFIANSTDN